VATPKLWKLNWIRCDCLVNLRTSCISIKIAPIATLAEFLDRPDLEDSPAWEYLNVMGDRSMMVEVEDSPGEETP